MPIGGFRAAMLGSSGGGVSLPSPTTKSVSIPSGQYLRMANTDFDENGAGASASDTHAWSFWLKRSTTGSTFNIFTWSHAGVEWPSFEASDKIQFNYNSNIGDLLTTATYTDTSAFHHYYLVFDSTNGTSGDRMRIYVDGTRVTGFDTEVYPNLNDTNAALAGNIDVRGNGLMFDFAYFEGSIPDISDVYGGGTPPDITGLTGLESHLNVDGGTVEADGVLTANWTNSGSVVSSTTIPS